METIMRGLNRKSAGPCLTLSISRDFQRTDTFTGTRRKPRLTLTGRRRAHPTLVGHRACVACRVDSIALNLMGLVFTVRGI